MKMVMEKENYDSFCIEAYQEEYDICFQKTRDEAGSQKFAMKQSLVRALKAYPDISPAEIWKSIHIAHMYRKTGMTDIDLIDMIVSADQSWKKSSGHAFEEMLKEYATAALKGTDIEIVLQRDLSKLLKNEELSNEVRDYSWLKEQVKGNIFDLFAIVARGGKKYCFSCIQAKTSVRDRVTRDREPSVHAMEAFFWSVIFLLDEDFMKMPKFFHMVNGGSPEFPGNGWHGMYVFSKKHYKDRIYSIDIDFQQFRKHAVQAADYWLTQRQWFNPAWRAE